MVKFKVGDSNRNSVDVCGRHFSGGTIYDTKIEGIPEDVVREHNFEIIGKTKKMMTYDELKAKNKDWQVKRLEKLGADNIPNKEDGRIKLKPYMHGEIAIYGYPGRKSGMEIEDLKKIYFSEIHPFTILMIHTTIKDVVGTIPMESIEKQKLPLANYYAMGHIHKRFEDHIVNSRYVYPGPTFPNNFQELSDLQHGSFQLVETDGANIQTKNIEIP